MAMWFDTWDGFTALPYLDLSLIRFSVRTVPTLRICVLSSKRSQQVNISINVHWIAKSFHRGSRSVIIIQLLPAQIDTFLVHTLFYYWTKQVEQILISIWKQLETLYVSISPKAGPIDSMSQFVRMVDLRPSWLGPLHDHWTHCWINL